MRFSNVPFWAPMDLHCIKSGFSFFMEVYARGQRTY